MMKKILFSFALLFAALNVMAEDCLKVEEFEAPVNEPNENYGYYFCIDLNNEVADKYTSLQFKLFLPEGMDLLTGDENSFDFDEDRCPGTVGRKGFTPDHAIGMCVKREDGSYEIALASSKVTTFKYTSGPILYVYYKTTDKLKEGKNTIKITNQKLVPAEGTKVQPADTETEILCYTAVATVKADGADSARKVAKDGKIVIVQEDGTEVGVDAIVQ